MAIIFEEASLSIAALAYLFPLLLLALAAAATWITYTFYLHPLSSLPGPIWAKISPLWLSFRYRSHVYHRFAIAMHARYGPLVRIAPNEVSVSDPEAVRLIYGTQSRLLKGQWYAGLTGSGPKDDFNLLGNMDARRHREGRQTVAPVYSLKSIRESEGYMDKPLNVFQDLMTRVDGREIDAVKWINMLTTDMLTGIIYGKRYGILENGKADEMLDFVDRNWDAYTPIGVLPWIPKAMKRLTRILWNLGLGPKAPEVIEWGTNIYLERVKNDDRPAGTKPDILDKLMKLKEENPAFDDVALQNQIFAGVFAGFETCGGTIPTIVVRIARDPAVQSRLHDELDEARRRGALSDPPRYDEVNSLPWLTACLSEGLRMHPITGISLAREVPKGGLVIRGQYLPAGVQVGINPWVLSYSDKVAKTPYQFMPQRWIDSTDQERQNMDRCNLAFGGGPFGCPGKVWAMILMYKLLAHAFMHFTFEPLHPHPDLDPDPDPDPPTVNEKCNFPVKWKDVKVRIRLRKNIRKIGPG